MTNMRLRPLNPFLAVITMMISSLVLSAIAPVQATVADETVGDNVVKVARAALEAIDTAGKPAIGVLVSRDGKVLLRHFVGMADIENKIPATANTQFRIGSVTKQFAAAAILKLAEQGKLSLDDTIDQWLPDFPRGGDVTVEHLLQHTSGIPSYTEDPAFYSRVTRPITEEALIATFAGKPFDFEPGTQFHYNNSGYFLLGHLVGKITGGSLAEFCQGEFFGPLGMTRTTFHTAEADLPDQATGYSMIDGKIAPALDWDMSHAGGAGAITSTLDDLMKWNEAVFAGKVLAETSTRKAWTISDVSKGEMNYGYGWTMDEHRGLREIGHNGGLDGWLSQLTRFVDQNVNIIVLQNSMPTAYPGLEPSELTAQMRDLFLAGDMAAPKKRVVDETVDPAIFDNYLGRYDYGIGVMTVSQDGDKLMTQITGQPMFQLFPEDERRFFLKVVDAQVEFLVGDDGKSVAVRHTQGKNRFRAERLSDEVIDRLTDAQLDEFVGRYNYFPAVMTVTRDGRQLIAQLTGQPAMPIFAVDETTFAWRIVEARVKFLRDEDGEVNAAEHTQNGVTFQAPRLPNAGG